MSTQYPLVKISFRKKICSAFNFRNLHTDANFILMPSKSMEVWYFLWHQKFGVLSRCKFTWHICNFIVAVKMTVTITIIFIHRSKCHIHSHHNSHDRKHYNIKLLIMIIKIKVLVTSIMLVKVITNFWIDFFKVPREWDPMVYGNNCSYSLPKYRHYVDVHFFIICKDRNKKALVQKIRAR